MTNIEVCASRPAAPPISASTTSITCAAASPTTACPRCCATARELRGVSLLTLLQSFACVRLVPWDETRRRLVSFRDSRAQG